jgi:hypothetical protein
MRYTTDEQSLPVRDPGAMRTRMHFKLHVHFEKRLLGRRVVLEWHYAQLRVSWRQAMGTEKR